MKQNVFTRPTLINLLLALGGLTSLPATAQTAANLYSFTPFTQNDGSNPNGGMVLSGNVLYGTTPSGGSNYNGTIFRVNTDGTGYTNLYTFSAKVYQVITNFGGGGIGTGGGGREGGSPTNTDGAAPNGGLVLSGSTLYGTAQSGGFGGYGTIFAIHTDGSGFTNLHHFSAPVNAPTNSDGISPFAGLILSGNTLFGTTSEGGSLGWGTVFRINTDGSGLTVLKAFSGLALDPITYFYSNTDGAEPHAHLILAGGTLYGTTSQGGSFGGGTIFSLGTNGSGFTTLHALSSAIDGTTPNALTLAGNRLYTTTPAGGPSGGGTLFAVNTNGSGFSTLHSFGYDEAGFNAYADVIVSSNIVYGATEYDTQNYTGTIFGIYADGTGFTTLYNFAALNFNTNLTGSGPTGILLTNNVFYGSAGYGGATGNGAIFSLSQLPVPSPDFNITSQGNNSILTWSTNAIGFTVQTTTNLAPPIVWTPVTPAPVVVNGLETVTNSVAGNLKYYRLIK